MRLLISLFFLIQFNSVQAQLMDSFTDGNFSSNPTWTGDAGEFIVNASQQLQSSNTVAASSYLSTALTLSSLDNMQWEFYIRQNFSASGSNFGRVYLSSDQSDLENPLNGYYLQFGEGGSNDAIELFRLDGASSTSVARGTNAFIASSFTIRVKITRDNNANWNIFADVAAGNNFVLQASGTDATYNNSQFFGVQCVYTVSNANNFYFDDFIVSPIVNDTIAPTIQSVSAISSTQLEVIFNEAVDSASAVDINHYEVQPFFGNPSAAQKDLSNPALVHLTYSNAFISGQPYTLLVNGVQDLNGNVSNNATGMFTYTIPVVAVFGDVQINEIMADPDPMVLLPNAEYIELYNRSTKAIDLKDWTLSDGSSTATFPSLTLLPQQYVIVCSNANSTLFSTYGTTIGLSSFPGLNNDGDQLELRNEANTLIQRVDYNDTWYKDNFKKNGGWSLELIDTAYYCPNENNWQASKDNRGGTPGNINSVNATFTDTQKAQLLRAYVKSPVQIQLYFSKAMDAASVLDKSNYSIGTGSLTPLDVTSADVFNRSVLVDLPFTMQASTIYSISNNSLLFDCPGNALNAGSTVYFGLADTAALSDVLINEVLFNPLGDGVDFVEIYNRSQKVIDLKNVLIGNADYNTLQVQNEYSIAPEGYLFFPSQYALISSSAATVIAQYPLSNTTAFIDISTMPSYNNDLGVVTLRLPGPLLIDQFAYTEDLHYPLLNNVEGVSLERLSFHSPTQSEMNWHSAAESLGFATPGYKNSQHSEGNNDNASIKVSPEVFSPDNDGHQDFTTIFYQFDNAGLIANVTIHDVRGRVIRKLVQNELLGNEGSFVWDGIDDLRQKARIGIYIIVIEVFDQKGNVKTYKKTCTLAAQLD
ncbi:MAG TPA: lamin tail domain-containing protein [Bacteroidia bacterium]|nr:lamin tail domain-containing protein [Bacteroidia bacterium]HNT80966.1 lamin tail domain-containing protein [Bacteroidia bacterium]